MQDVRWRVLIVDDHVVLAESISMVLGADARYDDVRVAHSLAEARALLAEASFDRAVVDVRLPDGDGTTLVPQLLDAAPDARVVVLTASLHPLVEARALSAGAAVVLPKGSSLGVLLAALGDDEHPARPPAPTDGVAGEGGAPLSPREVEVIELLAAGHDARGAARQLGLSVHTVRDHIKNAHLKLGVSTQVGAVVTAHRTGVIDLDGRRDHG